MSAPLLLCSDLDRTLLPNGAAPESPGARQRFSRMAAHGDVVLAYVTGRHLALVEKAIRNYRLPDPDFILADVGTTIYEAVEQGWRPWEAWSREIAQDWGGMNQYDLRRLLTGVRSLRIQEQAKQNTFKLSYYVPLHADRLDLRDEIQARLDREGVKASLIWSVDDPAGIGLLDILPARATKLHAVRFLLQRKGFDPERTLFAGDSGNDLPVLASEIPSVLVANATSQVRRQAQQMAAQQGHEEALYPARGDFEGMNGNYSAGILEGAAHYYPETVAWWRD